MDYEQIQAKLLAAENEVADLALERDRLRQEVADLKALFSARERKAEHSKPNRESDPNG